MRPTYKPLSDDEAARVQKFTNLQAEDKIKFFLDRKWTLEISPSDSGERPWKSVLRSEMAFYNPTDLHVATAQLHYLKACAERSQHDIWRPIKRMEMRKLDDANIQYTITGIKAIKEALHHIPKNREIEVVVDARVPEELKTQAFAQMGISDNPERFILEKIPKSSPKGFFVQRITDSREPSPENAEPPHRVQMTFGF